jgi:uncharacterized protein (TIGR00369 family)
VPDTDDAPDHAPARHAMRLVALEAEQTEEGEVRGWLPVTPAVAVPSGGPRLAAVAMLVDAIGGLRSLSAAAPDWAFTADLSIHLLPTGPTGQVRGDVHVRRRGRRTLVVEVDLVGDDDVPAGLATSTFAVVPRPDHLAGIEFGGAFARRPMAPLDASQPPSGPYLDELGVVAAAPGTVTVELRPEVANTVGALHGAVHTALADEAAASLATDLLGRPTETTDVHLAFLELGRTGPMTARARLVGAPTPDDGRVAVEVRVVDADGRLCSYATTEVVAS